MINILDVYKKLYRSWLKVFDLEESCVPIALAKRAISTFIIPVLQYNVVVSFGQPYFIRYDMTVQIGATSMGSEIGILLAVDYY